jgi:catalase
VNKHRIEGAYTYQFDGPMAYEHAGDAPKYAPNSYGAPYSDLTGPAEDSWETDGDMVRQAYTLRAEDDDFGQAGTLVREVFDDAMRERFVQNVAGHILGGVNEQTLPRVLDYWRNVDAEIGKRIEEAVHAGRGQDVAPHATEADPSEVAENPTLNKG